MSTNRSSFFMAIIALAVVLSMTACAELQVTKIKPGQGDGGLAYCLVVPKLQVTTKEAVVYDQGDRLLSPPYAEAARSIQERTVALVQVPSYEHYYSAKLKSGWFTADSYTIGYDTNGCLSTYNFTTVDQTATVITTLGSIALAAAPLAAGKEKVKPPQVTYAEPSEATYLTEWESAQVLKKAEAQIESLSSPGRKLTQTEEKQLSDLIDNAAKLRTLLNPTPTHVIKTEYVNLRFLPDDCLDADKYVVQQITEAEKAGNCNGFIPCENGKPVGSFIVGIALRLK